MGIIKINHKNNKRNVLPAEQEDGVAWEQPVDDVVTTLTDQADAQAATEDMEQVDVLGADRAVISEDESQATENSRLYYLNNGTAVSVISAVPSNYFDEQEKKWKKIDNTLTEVGDNYENINGAYNARISKAEKKRSVCVGKNKHQVVWEFVGKKRNPESLTSAVSDAESDNPELNDAGIVSFDQESELPVTTTLQVGKNRGERKHNRRKHRRLTDRAVYNNVDGQTDLEYRIYGDHVKENIIVKEKSDFYRYVFALQTQGLKMRLSDDNLKIELYWEDTAADGTTEQKVEFTIPAPYMYDAAGERCDEVYYELEPTDDGQYLFAVVASDEWINTEGRSFPVIIDPQLIIDDLSIITKNIERRTAVTDLCLTQRRRWKPSE